MTPIGQRSKISTGSRSVLPRLDIAELGLAYRAPAKMGAAWPSHVRRSSGRTPARPLPSGRRSDPAVAIAEIAGQRRRRIVGAIAEWVAAGLLMARGYRILDRRYRSQHGEIDVIAVRGQRLAFVEVKYRQSIERAAASITSFQTARISNAAEQWVWRNPRYHDCEIGLDAMLIAPYRLPRYVANALQPTS